MSLKTWFISTRPWSLEMTFVSTGLAGIFSYSKGYFSLTSFAIATIGLMIAHIAANMSNDYFDVKNGVDEKSPTSKYRPHPLLNKELNVSTYKIVIISLYFIDLLIAIYFTWQKGLLVLVFAALGGVLGFFYTADPIKFKYRSSGEISVFLVWGPLMFGGVNYILSGIIDIEPMLISIPIGLLVALVVYANNLRDSEFDAKVGIQTISTKTNVQVGLNYYKILLFSAYLAVLLLIITKMLSVYSLIVFLTLIESLNIIKKFEIKIPLNSDQITSQLTFHFGLLLISGELINLILNSFLFKV